MSTQLENRSQRPAEAQRRPVRAISTIRNWLAVLTVFLAITWIILGILIFHQNVTNAAGKTGEVAAVYNPAHHVPGLGSPDADPAGPLEYVPLVLSPPAELIPEAAAPSPRKIAWHFPGHNATRLQRLFKQIGLPEKLRRELRSMARPTAPIDGLSIYPSEDFVRGLAPESRAALYVALAHYRINECQVAAYRCRGDSPAEWFRDSSLLPETRRLVEPLIYRHAGCMFFADLDAVEDVLLSPDERLRLLKTLNRGATFLAYLRVTPHSDIDALVDYWGRGGREEEVRPILESLRDAGGEQRVNIVHLLPTFARCRIYTYPSLADQQTRRRGDGLWSALNFFEPAPDDRLAETAEVNRTMTEDYYRIHGNQQFGDLALLVDAHGALLHAAVYIADDVFFHNDGQRPSSPWTLVRYEQMKDSFPRREELDIRFYRRRSL